MSLAALVILGPFVAAALILGIRRWAAAFALGGAGVALVSAAVTLARVSNGDRFAATLPGLPGLPLRFVVDPLGALLAVTIATVTAFVFVYAVGYMGKERDRVRFFAALSFFVGAMQSLVLAGDWLVFLAAWELIALASYLLIGFWFERPGAGAAAMRAFVTTRAADVGLYIGIFALVTAAGTTEIAATEEVAGTAATLAGLGFLLAAMGKSAQVPLQGWLQDAMAGPTPVSALLHSATLVVSGVVLLIRAFPLLPPEVRLMVGVVGGATGVVAGAMAVAQRDLKRLLAASTSSQLGLMLLALGVGSVGAAVAHLMAHAAMKSALFLAAGMFQHARGSTAFDDLEGAGRRRQGAFTGFALAGLALAGAPPLAGFWSKDAVIAAALRAPIQWLFAPLAVTASVLTGVYIARALRLLSQPLGDDPAPVQRGAGGSWMGVGLAGLAALAAALGIVVEPTGTLLDVEVPEGMVALVLGLGAATVGLLVGWLVPAKHRTGSLSTAARDGFRVADGWAGFVVRPVLAVARGCDRLDRTLHRATRGVGQLSRDVAATGRRVEEGVHSLVGAVGRAGLAMARSARRLDEAGIDNLIRDLVTGAVLLGGRARRLQTGLVHQELLLAAGGVAVVLLVFLLT